MQYLLSQLTLFVYLVKAPKLVRDYPFTRPSNKLFKNSRHQADKHLSWPITFLKTLSLQKNTTSTGIKLLFKPVFLERYQAKTASVYRPL